MPAGHLPVVSYLAVPVTSATGVVIGGLFFGHPKPRVFNAEHELLVVAIASQAAIALDNAKLYEEVRHLNSKKDEFIGFASHELKTPLTTMNGYLQLAEKKPDLLLDSIPKIRKQIDRLNAIIADLLDISKIHAGKLELNYADTSLNTLINESVESVAHIASRHKLLVELPSEDIEIRVDAQKVGQVVINLLTNAIKYSEPHSSIRLFCSRYGDQVRISIEDEGMGIAPQHLDRIFNRFYRIAKSSSSTEGMGLGLYISQEIIAGHKGRIWAESVEGKGSTFHIDLPIISIESLD
jgi:signal transduction histidine kinase